MSEIDRMYAQFARNMDVQEAMARTANQMFQAYEREFLSGQAGSGGDDEGMMMQAEQEFAQAPEFVGEESASFTAANAGATVEATGTAEATGEAVSTIAKALISL